jgi:uncharacterized protein YdeI (YjbR/CyaY-like superfamily)
MSEGERPDEEVLRFRDQADFEAWLEGNHGRGTGVWLEIAKNNAGVQTISYVEAVEAALCFGWIDGQKGRGDHGHWRQRFTPRSPRRS